jgi:hypothetical protein
VKHGAAAHLVQAVADGKLDEEVLQRILKHRSTAPRVVDTTLRYVATNKVATARMLRTWQATHLL